jgi:hypothetical protein
MDRVVICLGFIFCLGGVTQSREFLPNLASSCRALFGPYLAICNLPSERAGEHHREKRPVVEAPVSGVSAAISGFAGGTPATTVKTKSRHALKRGECSCICEE